MRYVRGLRRSDGIADPSDIGIREGSPCQEIGPTARGKAIAVSGWIGIHCGEITELQCVSYMTNGICVQEYKKSLQDPSPPPRRDPCIHSMAVVYQTSKPSSLQ